MKTEEEKLADLQKSIAKDEARGNKIRKENRVLLALFIKELEGLKPDTINQHVRNVELYLNDYLAYHDFHTYRDGLEDLEDFFGTFLIPKCMWISPAGIKNIAASIKRFYKCLLDHKKITKVEYEDFCQGIKLGMEEWQAECEARCEEN